MTRRLLKMKKEVSPCFTLSSYTSIKRVFFKDSNELSVAHIDGDYWLPGQPKEKKEHVKMHVFKSGHFEYEEL